MLLDLEGHFCFVYSVLLSTQTTQSRPVVYIIVNVRKCFTSKGQKACLAKVRCTESGYGRQLGDQDVQQ